MGASLVFVLKVKHGEGSRTHILSAIGILWSNLLQSQKARLPTYHSRALKAAAYRCRNLVDVRR
jgi:hypothetical protein